MNWLQHYFDMLALGSFIPWGVGDFLFEDWRDPVCTFLGCAWPK